MSKIPPCKIVWERENARVVYVEQPYGPEFVTEYVRGHDFMGAKIWRHATSKVLDIAAIGADIVAAEEEATKLQLAERPYLIRDTPPACDHPECPNSQGQCRRD